MTQKGLSLQIPHDRYSKSEDTMDKNWISLEEAFKKETNIRENIDISKLCTFGIKPLDDAFIRICKNDLIVIGADTGRGKSTMALQIAKTNVQKGKKVALYYLEGGYEDAIAQMKWQDIANDYYKNHSIKGINMDYRDWKLNINKNSLLQAIECKIWEEYKEKYKNNLFFYNSRRGLTVDDLINSLLDFYKLVPNDSPNPFETTGKMGLDLIIIDHLQYFSLTKPESEIFEITEILRTVRSITNVHNVPIVLISHLRKKSKDRGLPDQEDFYGSSNIPKVATVAITIASDIEDDSFSAGIYPTYIRIVKSRLGIRSNYAFAINFNLHKRAYEDIYKMYRIDNHGNIPDKDKPLTEDEKPKWARRQYERGTETTD